MVYLGPFSSRPSVTSVSVGDSYRCTDSAYVFVKVGTAWQAFYQGSLCVPPVLGDFTATAGFVSPMTVDDSRGPIHIGSTGTGSGDLAGYYKLLPAGSATLTAGFYINSSFGHINTTDLHFGLGIGKSSTQYFNVVGGGVGRYFANTTAGLRIALWQPGFANYVGEIDLATMAVLNKKIWAKITVTPTVVSYYVGLDPNNLVLILADTIASAIITPFTPDTFGFFMQNTQFADVTLFHLSYKASVGGGGNIISSGGSFIGQGSYIA